MALPIAVIYDPATGRIEMTIIPDSEAELSDPAFKPKHAHAPAHLKGLEVLEVPAGLFAYTEHVGGMDTLVDSVRGFYSALDSLKGCTQRSGFHLEIYDERFDMSEPDSIMTIAAPVQRA